MKEIYIEIIGCSGSGKSYIANDLIKLLCQHSLSFCRISTSNSSKYLITFSGILEMLRFTFTRSPIVTPKRKKFTFAELISINGISSLIRRSKLNVVSDQGVIQRCGGLLLRRRVPLEMRHLDYSHKIDRKLTLPNMVLFVNASDAIIEKRLSERGSDFESRCRNHGYKNFGELIKDSKAILVEQVNLIKKLNIPVIEIQSESYCPENLFDLVVDALKSMQVTNL